MKDQVVVAESEDALQPRDANSPELQECKIRERSQT